MSKLIEISANTVAEFCAKAISAGIPRDLVAQVLEDILSSDRAEGEPIVGVFIDIAKEPTQVIGASTKPEVRFGDLLHSLFNGVAPTSLLDGKASDGALAMAHALASRPKEQEFLTPVVASHIRNIAIELRNTLLLEREDSLLMEALCKATDNRTVASLIVEAHEDNKATSLLLVALDYLLNSGLPLQATNLFLDTFGWVVDTGE